LEFAVVAPLFFLCLFGAVDAGLWALETGAEVAAVQQAARDAASAAGSPLSEAAPNAAQLAGDIAPRLRQSLFATTIVPWCGVNAAGCGAAACPASPAEVQARFGPRVVAICVEQEAPPACTTPPPGVASPFPPACGDSPIVTVRVIGYIAALVPPGLGIGAQGGEVPSDVVASTHVLRFAP